MRRGHDQPPSEEPAGAADSEDIGFDLAFLLVDFVRVEAARLRAEPAPRGR